MINIEGQVFGRLTVTTRAGSRGKGEVTWRCQCTCGNTTVASGYSLRSGQTKSCGCYSREVHRAAVTAASDARILDLTGQRFGKLTAAQRQADGRWSCLCDCGGTSTVATSKLTSGGTRSCGCLLNRKTTVSYQTLHKRVRAAKGPASTQACVDCSKKAAHWSYTGSDPAEMRSVNGCLYSLDLNRYVPRCVSCHREHDRQASALTHA